MKPLNLGQAVQRVWMALARWGRNPRPLQRSRPAARIFISPF